MAKESRRRVRDDAFQEKLVKYGLVESPVLNAREAEASAAEADSGAGPPVDQLKRVDHTIALTEKYAAEYTRLPVFKGERDVVDKHAQFLLDEMVRGNFNWDLVTLARCTYEGQDYKINGQHTCWARFATEMPDPQVREITYAAETAEQMRRIYRTFDRAKARTDAHLMQVELLGQDLDEDIPKRWASRAAAGLRMWKFEGEAYLRVRPEQLASLVSQPAIKPIFTAVALFCQSKAGDAEGLIKRQPVVAAMLETFSKDVTASVEFWSDVAEATNLVKGDARWLLHNYLERSVLNVAGGRNSARATRRQVVRSEDMYRICVNLWNKWRAGETLTNVRAPLSRPKAI